MDTIYFRFQIGGGRETPAHSGMCLGNGTVMPVNGIEIHRCGQIISGEIHFKLYFGLFPFLAETIRYCGNTIIEFVLILNDLSGISWDVLP